MNDINLEIILSEIKKSIKVYRVLYLTGEVCYKYSTMKDSDDVAVNKILSQIVLTDKMRIVRDGVDITPSQKVKPKKKYSVPYWTLGFKIENVETGDIFTDIYDCIEKEDVFPSVVINSLNPNRKEKKRYRNVY